MERLAQSRAFEYLIKHWKSLRSEIEMQAELLLASGTMEKLPASVKLQRFAKKSLATGGKFIRNICKIELICNFIVLYCTING